MAPSTRVIQVHRPLASSPLEEQLCQRYKTARLRALKEDPQAFSSTYEQESKFNHADWAKRLRNPLGKTFAVVRTEAGNNATEIEHLTGNEWLGMIVFIGPRALPADGSESNTPWKPFLPPADNNEAPSLASIEGSEAAYVAVSMFVLAEARRQGLGRKLIGAGVEAVRQEAISMRATRANVGLWVEADNKPSQRLYEECGFSFLPKDPALQGGLGVDSQVVMGKVIELSG
ncbi:hypothetical protein AJ79_01342 [Helicocarpus griseus UAMH5409]|uniref:N-acetyltransferase domain-containing protein n=1 Tax=Helicocarpus griseus UAMH5409 TaxID=1447875 RepID=A0A2B7XZH2_9EURO|nr:hypothetical protein AJ79_01342 [Helicocarpus griseus UAMH5409]